MARGFGARESSGSLSNMSFGALGYRVGGLNVRLSRLNDHLNKLKGPEFAWAAGSRALAKRIKSAEKDVEQMKYYISTFEKLVAEGRKGNLKEMGVKMKGKSKAEDYGAKLLAAQALLAEGIKIGPDFKETTPDKIFQDLKAETGREMLIQWDADGRFLLGLTGTKNSIKAWSPKEATNHPLGYTNYKGRDWHNHPLDEGRIYGFPPSGGDIGGLIAGGLSERLISAKEGTYVLRVPQAMRDKLDSCGSPARLHSITKAAMAVWKDSVARSLFAEGFGWSTDQQKADRAMLSSVKMLTEAAKKIGIEFEFMPRPGYEHLKPKLD